MRKQYICGENPDLENPALLEIINSQKHGKIFLYEKTIKEKKATKFLIKFEKTNSLGFFELRHIKNDQIFNRFERTVCGIGYLGNANCNDNKKLRQVWNGFISRCYNKNNKRYNCYGEKNITVSEKWFSLENFINDAEKIKGWDKEKFEKGLLQLDKDKNNGKIYSLENCEWLSQKENTAISNLKRQKNFKAVNQFGETFYSNNQNEFSKICGFSSKKINEVLRKKRKTYKKWTFEYLENNNEDII